MNTADFQRTCSDYVNKHVLTCISTLVSDNFSQWIEGDYEDELYAVTAQDDYETPVLDWLNNRAEDDQADELREWIEVNIGLAYCDDIETDKQLLSQGLDIITGSMDGPHDPDWRDLAEHLDIDPEQREALEHWIVFRPPGLSPGASRRDDHPRPVRHDRLGTDHQRPSDQHRQRDRNHR